MSIWHCFREYQGDIAKAVMEVEALLPRLRAGGAQIEVTYSPGHGWL